MDHSIEVIGEDRLIEDYLFTRHGPLKSSQDPDQQFARPIEDEDLFGVSPQRDNFPDCLGPSGPSTPADEGEDSKFSDHSVSVVQFDNKDVGPSSSTLGLESGSKNPNCVDKLSQDVIDGIFQDDFSSSPHKSRSEDHNCVSPTNENIRPSNVNYSSRSATHQQSPAQLRMKKMKEKLLEQSRILSIKPKKIGTGFNEDGTIEFKIEQSKLVSDGRSKLIFNKILNKLQKIDDAHGTPKRDTRSWESHKESLRKKICSQKRAVWDSFQRPSDDFDEEEELIEESPASAEEEDAIDNDDDDDNNNEGGEDSVSESDDIDEVSRQSEDDDDDEVVRRRRPMVPSDDERGNFEDLEREDMISSDSDR